MTLSQLLKIGIFLGSSLLAILVFLFTHQVVARLSEQVASSSRVLAQFCAEASFPVVRDPEMREIFSEVIASLDFPIVITDSRGLPRAWRQIDVPPDDVPASSLDSLEAGLEIAPVIRERVNRVRATVRQLDRRNDPIPMTQPGTALNLGEVHFGAPKVLERLRWLPFLSVGGVILLVSIGLWGLAIIRQAERRSIWVGMAKETAHQLGTPLSSLMGWVQLLRGHVEASPEGSELRMPSAEAQETVIEMERDVERLTKIAQRFSRVGSLPDLKPLDVTKVVREVVAYMRRRAPRQGGGVEIVERFESAPEAQVNAELLEWALENVVSNAINALDKRPGRIEVTVQQADSRWIEITVRDNGRGMSRAEQRRAFEPGYTTRPRGWGLGLPLARRVVQEYHGGRLFVRESVLGHGTEVVIRLPT